MNKMLWGWLIAAGLLLARLGYLVQNAPDIDAAPVAAVESVPQIAVLVLLTGGLLAGLFGVAGLLGMLGWVARPGQK